LELVFLPATHRPAGGPASVNHPGCPAAIDGGETINLIDRADVDAHYDAKHADLPHESEFLGTAAAAPAGPRRRRKPAVDGAHS
jgi:hypothetical protein